MRKIFIKKAALISAFLLLGVLGTFAQSTIHLCYSYPNSFFPIPIKINNQEVFTLVAKTQKTCTLHSEGKVIISFDTPCVNTIASPPITYQWADEIQLTLSKNSVHYIKIKANGMRYVMFEELSESDGIKEFGKKKYKSTPDYVEEPSNDSFDTGKRGKTPSNRTPATAPETESNE